LTFLLMLWSCCQFLAMISGSGKNAGAILSSLFKRSLAGEKPVTVFGVAR
jgi:hypothetical protein